jgi:NADPH:quinone reductase-like Zn-dependent oxidoreductase
MRYGPADRLAIQEVEEPVPRADEILIRVHASAVTLGNVMLRSLPYPVWLPMRIMVGLPRMRIPGHELAGEIEAIGRDVGPFRQGDPVSGTTSVWGVGSCAEYVCLPRSASPRAARLCPARRGP